MKTEVQTEVNELKVAAQVFVKRRETAESVSVGSLLWATPFLLFCAKMESGCRWREVASWGSQNIRKKFKRENGSLLLKSLCESVITGAGRRFPFFYATVSAFTWPLA